jgi:Flp pilus assembly protein TadG
MRVRMSPRFHEERGAVAVLVAICLLVLIGSAALAIDGGQLYSKRRHMQTASDSGALAAAQQCAEDGKTEADAVAASDSLATTNVPGAALDGTGFEVLQGACGVTSSGMLAVNYGGVQAKNLAPAIGSSASKVVHANATAIWGAAGAGAGVAPFSLHAGRLSECEIPPPDPDNPPTEDCKFYWNNNPDYIGQSLWTPLDLDKWNVVPSERCNGTDTNSLREWIAGSAPLVTLNFPEPTYVCNGSGLHKPAFEDLADRAGDTFMFPVNSPCAGTVVDPEIGPIMHGQIDSSSTATEVCPPVKPDKFDIVGFAQLEIVALWSGNDKEFATECAEFTVSPPYPAKKDPNSWCMIARWVGYTTGGSNPGGGSDFGVTAVGLTG